MFTINLYLNNLFECNLYVVFLCYCRGLLFTILIYFNLANSKIGHKYIFFRPIKNVINACFMI